MTRLSGCISLVMDPTIGVASRSLLLLLAPAIMSAVRKSGPIVFTPRATALYRDRQRAAVGCGWRDVTVPCLEVNYGRWSLSSLADSSCARHSPAHPRGELNGSGANGVGCNKSCPTSRMTTRARAKHARPADQVGDSLSAGGTTSHQGCRVSWFIERGVQSNVVDAAKQ
nr:hypothetical protein CFP56_23960 [Quercus suber]